MTGLYRSDAIGLDIINQLDEAKCADAPGYLFSTEGDWECYNHNWWGSFDHEGWSTSNNGYYMTGLYRSSGSFLHNIEESRCCRRKSQMKWELVRISTSLLLLIERDGMFVSLVTTWPGCSEVRV